MKILTRLFACLAAGAVGALVNSVAVWAFGKYGLSQALAFNVAPPLTWAWLGPRLLYGALWALPFALPFWKSLPWLKGLLLSLPPSAYMLLKVFPELGKGMWGLGAGAGAPYMVLFFNAIWGLATIGFLMASQVGAPPPSIKK